MFTGDDSDCGQAMLLDPRRSLQVPENARRDPEILNHWEAGGDHKRWLLRINGLEMPYQLLNILPDSQALPFPDLTVTDPMAGVQ